MSEFLILAFLFFLGSVGGWVLELFFRRFFTNAHAKHKWINPGFCVGPYLPIYGFGLCSMYMITMLGERLFPGGTVLSTLGILLAIAVCMTLIEYIGGILCLKVMKTQLWDYSKQWGNIQGIICPLFSVLWAGAGALYYFFLHGYMRNAIYWLSQNLAFSFVIGMFYGIFLIDVVYSTNMIVRVRSFAARNDVVVKYEQLKAHIQLVQDKAKQKRHFFLPLHTQRPIGEWLKELYPENRAHEKRAKKRSMQTRSDETA